MGERKISKFERDLRQVSIRMALIVRKTMAYPFAFVREFIIAPLRREDAIVRAGAHFQGVQVKQTPLWQRTEDVQGHAPDFKVRCHFCDCPMALRHSVIFVGTHNDNEGDERNINQMSYKCPKCAWFVRFMVVDDVKYLKKVKRAYRHGSVKFLPTIDDWSKENEEIGRQLKALGYWAGR